MKMIHFHRSLPVVLTSLGLLLALTQLAPAQRGRGGFGRFSETSKLQLASLDRVQAELNLNEDQKQVVTELNEKLRAERTELFQGGGDRSAAREKYATLTRELTAKCIATLDASQRQRLQEIYIQVNGASALDDEKIAESLAITQEQKAKLAELREQRIQALRGSFRDLQGLSNQERQERIAELRRPHDEKMLAVLTDQQRAKFEEMKGEKIELDLSQLRRRRQNN